jgi:ribosomal protein S17E
VTQPSSKTAGGITVYIQEELTDARLRCEQLKGYVTDAVKMVQESDKRDHFFEVAGNLIYGIPEALFKLDKALSATALAVSRLDYQELKQDLKPEKADELERVLNQVRIQVPQRRSQPLLPHKEASTMYRIASTSHVAPALRRIAEFITTQPTPRQVEARVRRVLMAMSQTAQEAVQAMGDMQAGSREEVMEGFKSANPSLSKEQLEEIADHWEENKDVVKDKQASSPRRFPAAPPAHVHGAILRTAAAIEAGQLSPSAAKHRLHRVLMAMSQTAQEAINAMGPVEAGSREEVMEGFKSSNPALSKEQLEEIADHWEENKDVVKDKQAALPLENARFVQMVENMIENAQGMLKQVERLGGIEAALTRGHGATLQGQLREIDSVVRVLQRRLG